MLGHDDSSFSRVHPTNLIPTGVECITGVVGDAVLRMNAVSEDSESLGAFSKSLSLRWSLEEQQ